MEGVVIFMNRKNYFIYILMITLVFLVSCNKPIENSTPNVKETPYLIQLDSLFSETNKLITEYSKQKKEFKIQALDSISVKTSQGNITNGYYLGSELKMMELKLYGEMSKRNIVYYISKEIVACTDKIYAYEQTVYENSNPAITLITSKTFVLKNGKWSKINSKTKIATSVSKGDIIEIYNKYIDNLK